jgi:flagellar assembly factor FliW
MNIDGTRFGSIEIEEAKTIELPAGLVGFPTETRFALLESRPGSIVAYLQSLTTPGLAFPVVDGALLGPDYPTPPATELGEAATIGSDELTVLVIVAARPDGPRLVANMLAPIVVNSVTRKGAQVVLDPYRYSAAAPLGSPSTRPTVAQSA